MLVCLGERETCGWDCRQSSSELTSHMMELGGGGGAWRPGSVTEAKIVSRRARPLVVISGRPTRLEVRVDGADAEADIKRVSRVTLPFV